VRRRRALLTAALTLVGVYSAFGPISHLLGGRAQTPGDPHGTYVSVRRPKGKSAVRWPLEGQGAFVLGNARATASPSQRPAPIASLAKVMTAYLTLKLHPLTGTQPGFTVTITPADVEAEAEDVSEGQSGVAVQVGEQLTERQLLEALLIPSGNNIAELLAERIAGSESGFIGEMNVEARALGMRDTVYTDASGFDPGTQSTAADQLRVFRWAMRSAVFRQIVSMSSVTLPVAGTLRNFNPLIAEGYSGKTGSDSAARGCLAFFTRVTVGGHRQTAVGVVMGQGEGNNTSEILSAAGEAAQELVASATQTTTRSGPPLPVAGGRRAAGGLGVRRPPAPSGLSPQT
jgi:serine-type D-Ala-D-Ala carboxypeptidase (penicillin-binding protein 5/6)